MTGSSIRASHDGARLEVWRKVQLSARSGDYRSEPLATFELRFLEDLDPETGRVAVEVVLLKSEGDGTSASEQEAIYSETITERGE